MHQFGQLRPIQAPSDMFIIIEFLIMTLHDDVIKWKHFPRYWPFVRGIHRSPVTRSFDVFFDLRLNKQLSKQSWGWWFETPSCSLWRHCNEEPVHHQVWYWPLKLECSVSSIRRVNWGKGMHISNYIHCFLWEAITHPCPNYNEGLTEPLLKIMNGWVMSTSHWKQCM